MIAPLAPLAAVAAIATAPTPAIGDTVCPPGANGHPTPCSVVCHVPRVVGLRYRLARKLIREHNCLVGNVTVIGRTRTPPHHYVIALIVVKQKPKAGVYLAKNSKVNLTVRWLFAKHKYKHHKKH